MAKLLYSATISLDGFIAGPGGDMSWLTEHFVSDGGTNVRLTPIPSETTHWYRVADR